MRTLFILGAAALTASLAGCGNMPAMPIPGVSGLPIPGAPSPSTRDPGGRLQTIAQAAQAVTTATKDTSEAEEIQIGQEVAMSLLGAAPLVKNDRLQRYVNQVGRWVASQSERPDLPWQFGVIDNENVNAFAAPGGAIFITNGLLKKMQSESELAGVLAHEIVHVVEKHHLNAMRSGGWADLAKIGLQAGIDNKLGRSGAGQVARAAGLGEMGAELIKQGFFVKPLDRGLEEESDRKGVILAARAGYDPYGLVTVLQVLQGQATDDPFMALLFKTHPSPSERIDSLEKLADTLDKYRSQDQGRDRFAAATGLRLPAPPRTTTPAATPAKPPAKPSAKPPTKAGG
jgi:beta-barrel assembly-enhancing protease